MSKAVVFFADGTEECEALLVIDLLRRAKVEVTVASAMGRKELVSSHKIRLTADALAEDVDYSDVDLVVLPGGIPGTPNLAANKTVTDTCAAFAPRARRWPPSAPPPASLPRWGCWKAKTPPPMRASKTSLPVRWSTMKRSSWMGTSPPATASAALSPLHWTRPPACRPRRSRPYPERHRVSAFRARINTKKENPPTAGFLFRLERMHPQLMRIMVQHLAAVLGDEDQIFDPDAELAGKVDARLDGEAHARGDNILVHRRDVTGLVVFQTNEVAQAVVEVGAIAGFGSKVAGRSVNIAETDARLDQRFGGGLCLPHQLIDLALLLAGLPGKERPGHIGTVILIHAAHIDQDALARLQRGVVVVVVRVCRMSAKTTDGGES